MWRTFKSNGSAIYQKVKEFFGILDTSEDIDNLKEKFESRVQSGHYGMSVQKQLPEFMQTNSHKKNKALKEMKEAFSQLAVDQVHPNELQELIKTSVQGMVSCPNLSDASVMDSPRRPSHRPSISVIPVSSQTNKRLSIGNEAETSTSLRPSINVIPAPSHMVKRLSLSNEDETSTSHRPSINVIPAPSHMVKRLSLSNEDETSTSHRPSINVIPASSHMMKRLSLGNEDETSTSHSSKLLQGKRKNSLSLKTGISIRRQSLNSPAKSSFGIFKKISPSQENVESSFQHLGVPSFQSSIRLRCSNTAKSFSASNVSLSRPSQVYKLEDFIQLNDIVSIDNPEEIASLKTFENEMKSVLNMTDDSHISANTFVGLGQEGSDNPGDVKWMYYNESADKLKDEDTSHSNKESSSLECDTVKENNLELLDYCTTSAEPSDSAANFNVKAQHSETSTSCCFKPEHFKFVFCNSTKTETTAVSSVKAEKHGNVRDDKLNTESASSSVKTSKSDNAKVDHSSTLLASSRVKSNKSNNANEDHSSTLSAFSSAKISKFEDAKDDYSSTLSTSCSAKTNTFDDAKTKKDHSSTLLASTSAKTCKFNNAKSGHLSRSQVSHCTDKNNSSNAVLCRTNKICPTEFEANIQSFGLEMNINNHAVGSSTEQNRDKISSNMPETSAGTRRQSMEQILKTWTRKNSSVTDIMFMNSSSTSHHNWQATEIDGEDKSMLNVELLEVDEMLTGREALEHYLLFTALERAVQIQKLEAIRENIVSDYKWKIEIVDEIYETAKSYYSDPKGMAKKKWKALRSSISQQSKYSIMDIRDSSAKFGRFLPIFTYLIIVIQVMSCSILCSLYGITSVGIKPTLEFKSNVVTFLGRETIHRWTIPNIWIGISMHNLIGSGAVFGLCMRDNIHTRIAILQYHNFSKTMKLGCCEVPARNTAGTLTKSECLTASVVGRWQKNIPCHKRVSGQNSVADIIRPCCIDLQGICLHTSHTHCLFMGGFYHQRGVHCSQINCANDICRLGGLKGDPDQPWVSKNASQWGRLILSMFYTHGIIHALLIVIGNWILSRPLERSIGWLRMLIIYWCCGFNGSLCASLFSPFTPQVSTTASLMGTVGVITVELTQAWKLIHRPWIELAKIFAFILFCFMLGSLPFVSNYAVTVGYLTGIICAIAFLPYITFGQWTKKTRLILCIGALSVLLMTHFLFLYLFYYIQDASYCQACRNFDCLSYVKNMCNQKLLYYNSETEN